MWENLAQWFTNGFIALTAWRLWKIEKELHELKRDFLELLIRREKRKR